MTPAYRIQDSFLFRPDVMPPADAPFEVEIGDVECMVLSQWVASAILMFSNANEAIASGEIDDEDFADYCERYGSPAGLQIASQTLVKIASQPSPVVLDFGELCCLAVLSSIRALARKPGDDVTELLVNFFSRVRERIVEDAMTRAEL